MLIWHNGLKLPNQLLYMKEIQMEFRLEKGKKYDLSRYENGFEGEYVGILRKSCGTHHHNRLIFKLEGGSYCIGDAETKLLEDGTICVVFDVYEFKNTLEEVMNPEVRPKEIRELL